MNQNKDLTSSFQAGQTAGQAQEKTNQVMDKASHAAQSMKESCQEAGQQMQAKAEGAVNAVKQNEKEKN